MPTRSLQFEGAKLGSLLEQVQAEIGPKARIVKAERTRHGGFAGFFARERFVVTVEVDEDDEIGGEDELAAPMVDESSANSVGPTNAWAGASGAPVSSAADRTMLADRTEDILELSTLAPSPDTASFAAVLASIGRGIGRSTPPTEQPSTPASAPAPAPAPPVPPVPPVPPPVPPAAPPVPPVPPPVPPAAPPPAPLAPPAPAPVSAVATDSAPGIPQPGVAMPAAHSMEHASSVQMMVTTSVAVSPVTTALCAAGVPQSLLPDPTVLECLGRLADGDGGTGYLNLALTRMFEQLPALPSIPVRHGSVFVVVGELQRAQQLAAQLASETGLDAGDMMVAAESKPRRVSPHQFIRTTEEAFELSPGWRRGPKVTMVAVGTVLAGPSRTWARHLLEALRPTAVWGVAPATQKSEDIVAWAHDLGGFDALALDGVADTVSPASAVAAGIPIVRLDGHPATASLWASVVAERLMPQRLTPERMTPERKVGQLSWC